MKLALPTYLKHWLGRGSATGRNRAVKRPGRLAPDTRMTPGRAILRKLAGFRVRVAVLLLAGLAFQAAGFEALITTLTHRWLTRELHTHARTLSDNLARRAGGPTALRDVPELSVEARSALADPDVVGIEIWNADGRRVTRWTAAGENPAAPAATGPRGHQRAARTFAVESPVRARHHGPRDPVTQGPEPHPAAVPATGAPALGSHGSVGIVRLVVSTQRIDDAVATTARLGLIVLLAAFALGALACVGLIGLVVRPLEEASGLAREIARGNLSRRLPVRTDDEIGGLAESMNTMAASLTAAQRQASSEAERLRTATDAVLAIAREARTIHEPREVFQLVATHVRRVAPCEGVALAVPGTDSSVLEFAYLDPPSPWSVLREDEPLDYEIVCRIEALEAFTRITLDADDSAFAAALRAEGFRAALLVPLTLEFGPPALLVLAARDVGAFDASEAEVVAGLASHLSSALRGARLNHTLEHAIAELDRTRDVLVQSGMLRVAGEMASGVAHEFNNILGAVLGRAQLLSRAVEDHTIEPEQLRHGLAVIERVAEDGGETVRRLRLFGRTGQQTAVESVDLDVVVRDAVEFTRPRWSNEALASGRAIDVDIDMAPGLWSEGRPHELREVFTNLLLNAADAMPDGGTIRVHGRRSGCCAVVAIEDDGTGMSDETRRRLFEPFFTTKGESGTGLGMSVAYGIVRRHEGTIEATSRASQGTRVEVTLPITDTRPATALPVAPFTSPDAPLEVLVIDDEEAVRDLMSDILRMLGHRVTTHGTGLEALSAYIPGHFQLVVTDIGMPGITGWQIAGVVRAIDPDVMLAFVTGWAEDVSVEALKMAGVDEVIAKPFKIEDIQRVAEAAVARGIARAA